MFVAVLPFLKIRLCPAVSALTLAKKEGSDLDMSASDTTRKSSPTVSETIAIAPTPDLTLASGVAAALGFHMKIKVGIL